MIGHSLGTDIALGVANDPPAGLRAVVLVDGGYLDAAARTELGLPVTAGMEELIAWCEENSLRFPDWETAVRKLAAFFGAEATAVVEGIVHDSFVSVDGEIRESLEPERVADLLLVVLHQDVAARARAVDVPTLLSPAGNQPNSDGSRSRLGEHSPRRPR